jgi:hypothetical protein
VNVLAKFETVFENEEAVRLLNYLVSYKEFVNKNENNSSRNLVDGELAVQIAAEPIPTK